MIALPSLASLFVSLVSINEWKRRVVETELGLLTENFEWYHLATKSAQT